MDPITAALGLAKFVPDVVRWIAGDDKANMAQKVVNVAQAVTGHSDAKSAVDAIEADPALQIELARAMQPVIVARYQAETQRLETINATMRVEIQSNDKFKSYWRPTFGYVLALSWGGMMAAVIYAIVTSPAAAPLIINAFSAMGAMWSVALAVLGVQISARSKDKQLANGQAPAAGIMAAITKRIAG